MIAMPTANHEMISAILSGPGPYDIMISSSEGNLTMTDVMFGDVWLCSGQSNMQFTLSMVSGRGLYWGIYLRGRVPMVSCLQFQVAGYCFKAQIHRSSLDYFFSY